MSFFVTPARRLHLVRAWSYLTLVVGLIALSLTIDLPDVEGRIFGCLIVGFFFASSLFNFWKARQTSPMETVVTNSDLAPVPDQVRYYRRMLLVSAIAFPTLSAWTIYSLNLLESGVEKSVEVWGPISFVYEFLGYWPAALALPLLGMACCAVFVGRLRKLAAALPRSVKVIQQRP
jgi:hypothetical protein